MWAAHGPSAGSGGRGNARRDSGGGAEARVPYRRRRAHSHRPGLCSDKWGASCPDVWSRGRRASPRQRGSCLGRRRSDGGPGPTKPVQPLTAPRRGASPRTCAHPPPPRNTPPTRPSRQRPGIQGGGAGCPPLCAITRTDPATLSYKAVAQRPPATQPASTRPSTHPHDSQSKEASQSKNQPPLFPPDPLQKSEKKVKDNLKWRIN